MGAKCTFEFMLLLTIASSCLFQDIYYCLAFNCSLSQFQCKNGECLDLHYRCDGYTYCRDNSDEQECETLKFPKDGYGTYTEFRAADRRLKLFCVGDPDTTLITLRQFGGQVLSQTTSNVITYELGSLQCEHMGAYVCDKYSSKGNHSIQTDLLVNVCPPILCPDKQSHRTLEVEFYNDVSFTVCLWLPRKYRFSLIKVVFKNESCSIDECSTRCRATWLSRDYTNAILNITLVNVTGIDVGENSLEVITENYLILNVISFKIHIKSKETTNVNTQVFQNATQASAGNKNTLILGLTTIVPLVTVSAIIISCICYKRTVWNKKSLNQRDCKEQVVSPNENEETYAFLDETMNRMCVHSEDDNETKVAQGLETEEGLVNSPPLPPRPQQRQYIELGLMPINNAYHSFKNISLHVVNAKFTRDLQEDPNVEKSDQATNSLLMLSNTSDVNCTEDFESSKFKIKSVNQTDEMNENTDEFRCETEPMLHVNTYDSSATNVGFTEQNKYSSFTDDYHVITSVADNDEYIIPTESPDEGNIKVAASYNSDYQNQYLSLYDTFSEQHQNVKEENVYESTNVNDETNPQHDKSDIKFLELSDQPSSNHPTATGLDVTPMCQEILVPATPTEYNTGCQ